MDDFRPAGDVTSFPMGKGKMVVVEGREVAIYNVEGQFYALDNRCPHRGGPLGEGFVDGKVVFCPLHGWGFDVQTGQCQDRPDRPARSYPTRVIAGIVEVSLVAPADLNV